jgi:sn-glycerol 3-phosphate transport system ATP-binding protein
LPINSEHRRYAGRKMTLGIRPEHFALSSQAEGGVPLVMDTLEILGADNLPTGAGASKSWWSGCRISSVRRQAARCGCICRRKSAPL